MPTTTGLATSFINFSRPGASGAGATVTDRDGKIKWAGHNLLAGSESFDGSNWVRTNATVAANNAVAPNGTTTAEKVSFTAQFANLRSNASVLDAGVTYTFGMWVWVATGTRTFSIRDNISTEFTTITATTTPTLYTVTFTAPAASALIILQDRAASGFVDTYIWGAHLYRSDMQMQLNPAMPAGMQSYYPTTPRNLLGWTEDFSTGWTRTNILAFGSGSISNAAVAPNGLQTADKIVPTTAANDRHSIYQIISLGSGVNVISVYAKAGEYSLLRLADQSNGTFYASYDLAAGSVVAGLTGGTKHTSSAIASAGNGWYRCSMVVTNVAASTAIAFGGYPSGATLDNFGGTFTGDGTSGIYLWGAQLSDSASLDTYVPVYGAAVTSAAYYAPRLDFDGATLSPKGLLVEELRTNLLLHTAAFDNVAWSKYEVNTTGTPAWVNVGTAPDGTATAEKLIETTVNDAHIIYRTETLTAAAYTFSVYAKAAERSILYLRLDTGGAKYAYFNLSTGAASNVNAAYTAAITPVGNGWYRCAITATGTAASYTPVIGVTTTAGTPTYAGDGTSGLLIWGAQLEAGSFATSYIPNGSAVAGATRAADVASVSTQAFPYSATEGTLVVSAQIKTWAASDSAVLASLDDNNAAYLNFMTVAYVVNGNYTSTIRAANADTFTQSGSAAVNNATVKLATAYKTNDSQFSYNGTANATDTTVTLPGASVLTQMSIGRLVSLGYLNGHVRQITYIPRRLTAAELNARTA